MLANVSYRSVYELKLNASGRKRFGIYMGYKIRKTSVAVK